MYTVQKPSSKPCERCIIATTGKGLTSEAGELLRSWEPHSWQGCGWELDWVASVTSRTYANLEKGLKYLLGLHGCAGNVSLKTDVHESLRLCLSKLVVHRVFVIGRVKLTWTRKLICCLRGFFLFWKTTMTTLVHNLTWGFKRVFKGGRSFFFVSLYVLNKNLVWIDLVSRRVLGA